MVKKAQVSIFIIIAIVIVLVVALLFVFMRGGSSEVNPLIAPVHNYIVDCIKETGEEGISVIGKNGGYVNVPESSTEDNLHPYYFVNGQNKMPSYGAVERELSLYVQANLDKCFDDFSNFPDFEVSYDKHTVTTTIKDIQTVFEINRPIIISKGEHKESVKFKGTVNVRLGIILDLIKNYMENQEENPKEVCVSCLHSLSIDNDLYVELNDYDETAILFTIYDENSTILDEDYMFEFANNYEVRKNEVL
ncbi:hypothetical protein HOD75_00265 [archaeon]|jgi:hypothetical protein|nr:hypothetical protein [archaeon]MBT4241311.1 hypothetical protein [archaeon]MBT4418132.1 hypothetical protein [archaeon]